MSDEITIQKSWLRRLVELTGTPIKEIKKLSSEEKQVLNRLEIPRLLGYCQSAEGFLGSDGELKA